MAAADTSAGANRDSEAPFAFDAEGILTRAQRRRRRQIEQRRWQDGEAAAPSRAARLLTAADRLEDDLEAGPIANEAYAEHCKTGPPHQRPASVRRPDQALRRACAARREDQPDRLRQRANKVSPRVRAGLQRPGSRRPGIDRARRGDHYQHRRLVPLDPMTAPRSLNLKAGISGDPKSR